MNYNPSTPKNQIYENILNTEYCFLKGQSEMFM